MESQDKHLKIVPIKSSGGQTVLSLEEESELVSVIEVAAEWGYPLTMLDVRLLVKSYLDLNGKIIHLFVENLPGKDWGLSFVKRHKKEISLRKCQNIKRNRAKVSSEDINAFFDKLEVSLANVPAANIVNYDETNLTDDPGSEQMLVRRSSKHADRVIDSSKTSTSVMFAGTASGKVLPRYIVYKALHLYDTWTERGPEGAIYNRTSSGWFDMDCFEDWFFKIALKYFKKLPADQPKVLLGDNLASHLSPNVIKACIVNNVRFVFLPPNSTHLTQPLDVAWFRPFKSEWRKILSDWKKKHRGVIPKGFFPHFLKLSITNLGKNASINMKAGFVGTGVYPLNREKVLKRLPGFDSTANISVSDALVQVFKVERNGIKQEEPEKKKVKKLNVKPGESVASEDVLKILENQTNNTKKKQPRKGKDKMETKIDQDLNVGEDSENKLEEKIPKTRNSRSNSQKVEIKSTKKRALPKTEGKAKKIRL